MQSYTAAQAAILTGPALIVSAGAELLAGDLTVVQDISDDLASCTVDRNNKATIHGTVKMALSRELAWGSDLVRTRMTISDGVTSATWYTGVWSLATPERRFVESPATYDCSGFDRLFLLSREIGAGYSIAAGADVLTAVRQAITDAGLSGVLLDGSAAGQTVPRPVVYPLSSQTPATWLRVINDLLQQVNYRGMYCDQLGRFRSEPYASPSTRPVEWTFDGGAATILGEDMVQTLDLWAIPNRWIFRQSNRADGSVAPVEGNGVYTVNNLTNGLSSQGSRSPKVWPTTIDYEAASQAALVSLGDRRVASDLRASASYKVSTSPLPIAGHSDVAVLAVDGALVKVQAHSWSMPHDGSDMTWVLEAIS